MKFDRLRPLLIAIIIALGLAGCATEPKKLILKTAPAAKGSELFWPPQVDGEVPRYVYVGELAGDPNFVHESNKPNVTLVDVLNWVAGGIIGEEDAKSFFRPQTGLVDSTGRILVTDFGRGSIFVFDDKAGRLDEWNSASKTRRLLAPAGIAEGPGGDFFVTDADNAVIVRLNAAGEFQAILGEGQLIRPTGIAYEASSKLLFVADTYSHHIKIFNLKGELMDIWGDRGDETDAPRGRPVNQEDLFFNMPTHLAVANGKLFITDTMNARIQVIATATGKLLQTIGKRGTYIGNLVRPKGVAVDSEENVYVVEGYHDHLLIYNRNGQFLMSIGGEGTGPGQFNLPTGIWIDSHDRIFVADSQNERVQIFQFLGGGTESGR